MRLKGSNYNNDIQGRTKNNFWITYINGMWRQNITQSYVHVLHVRNKKNDNPETIC